MEDVFCVGTKDRPETIEQRLLPAIQHIDLAAFGVGRRARHRRFGVVNARPFAGLAHDIHVRHRDRRMVQKDGIIRQSGQGTLGTKR